MADPRRRRCGFLSTPCRLPRFSVAGDTVHALAARRAATFRDRPPGLFNFARGEVLQALPHPLGRGRHVRLEVSTGSGNAVRAVNSQHSCFVRRIVGARISDFRRKREVVSCGWRSQFHPDCPGGAWKAACSEGAGGIGGVTTRMMAHKPATGTGMPFGELFGDRVAPIAAMRPKTPVQPSPACGVQITAISSWRPSAS